MLNIRPLTFNLLQERSYVVWGTPGRCVLIDPGCYGNAERQGLEELLAREGLTPEAILLTHGHFDHIFGVEPLQERYGIPVYMHPAEQVVLSYSAEMARRLGLDVPGIRFRTTDVADGQVLTLAGMQLEVIATPGHTPGGVCWLERSSGVLFTGDTLFAGSIGRTDFRFSDYDDEIRSIMERLILLDPAIRIFPGHGPASTIGQERRSNPFLEPFNEPEEPFDPDLEPVLIRGE